MSSNGSVIRAAGGVLWRTVPAQDGEAIEVAIIHRPMYQDWSLPKGKLASGEREVDGAIREVLEETGYHVRLGRSLGETRYLKEQDDWVRPKVVRWWAMEASSGAFTPTREVDELRWASLAEAHEILTRDMEREVLERFVRGPAPSRMVLLVRHASAGSRGAWSGDDRLRPLDACGWAQADELVRLLAHFDPVEIVSADYVRCVQTVAPLSAAMGVPIRQDPLLSEPGYPEREDEALALLRASGGSHGARVICSQGDVIPDLLRRLSAADDVDFDPLVVPKGGTWALTFRDDRLVSAESFLPPELAPCLETPTPVAAGVTGANS